jgi:hypothetical protein
METMGRIDEGSTKRGIKVSRIKGIGSQGGND